MRNIQLTPALVLLLLSGKSLAQTCSTLTTGVNPVVTDFAAFESKLAPFTSTATGANIPVYTDTVDLGGTTVTGVGYAKSDALVAAGYTVTSGWTNVPCTPTSTSASATGTGGLPPKPSGNCRPHGDHWDCDKEEEDHDDHKTTTSSTPASTTATPSTPSPTGGKNCVAHGDHWDCEGEHDEHDEDSATKTTKTPATPSPTNGKNCVAHGDHWDCEGEHEEDSGTKTTETPATPSPTDGKNCVAHGDHWDCDGVGADHSTNSTTKKNSTSTTAPVKGDTEDSGALSIKLSVALASVLGSAVVALLL